jgi:Tfp pilus assembly protein PilE
LIELVVVVAVLAILAAVAIPSFTSLSDDARLNSSKQMLVGMYKECKFNEARTGTASHTALSATANAEINGVTFSGDATVTTCAAANAIATVVSGGTTCVLNMKLGDGVKTHATNTAGWPSNHAAC